MKELKMKEFEEYFNKDEWEIINNYFSIDRLQQIKNFYTEFKVHLDDLHSCGENKKYNIDIKLKSYDNTNSITIYYNNGSRIGDKALMYVFYKDGTSVTNYNLSNENDVNYDVNYGIIFQNNKLILVDKNENPNMTIINSSYLNKYFFVKEEKNV